MESLLLPPRHVPDAPVDVARLWWRVYAGSEAETGHLALPHLRHGDGRRGQVQQVDVGRDVVRVEAATLTVLAPQLQPRVLT